MKNKLLAILAVGLLAGPMAANAIPVSWQLTLTDGLTTYDGTLSIDDSFVVPNAFVTFSNFLSFNIAIGGSTYILANAFRPNDEGLLFDSSGSAFRFDDPTGNFTEFCAAPCISFPALSFQDGTNNWSILNGQGEAGTYALTRVPEPGTLALLGLGLMGLGFARRRKLN